jgi:hypothetical protein
MADGLGPIYIGGPDRCGKTLVAAILGSHSRLAIPIVGSNLWSFFYGQFGDLGAERNLDRCLAAMQRYKHARFLGVDVPRLRREFGEEQRSYARLFALIHEHFAERQGKPRWGDQTGLVERYADQIFAAYPGVRMIQMVRDPRDRYEASLRLWPAGRGRAGGAVARWRYSVAFGERNAVRYGSSYRVLRYEDLVSDPESVTRDLCAFVGEEFEPEMLELRAAPSYRQKLEAGSDRRDRLISARYIGEYRGRIPLEEVAFIQHQLRRPMRRLGYAFDATPMSTARRLRYLTVGWPVEIVRMFAWTMLERLQHRAPGVIGRRPATAKVLEGR